MYAGVYGEHTHHHIFDCKAPDSAFLHLFEHLKNNDNRMLDLLSGENNGLFLQYFKKGLLQLVYSQLDKLKKEKHNQLPQDFLANHIASTFVETVKWWVDNGKKESCNQITNYFLQ